MGQLIANLANKLKCDYEYNSFKVGSAPDPSETYLIFNYPNREDAYADNQNYAKITALDLEFYSDKKRIESEIIIEDFLETNELLYTKTESFLDSEQMYMVLYEMEVLING